MRQEHIPGTAETISDSTLLTLSDSELAVRCEHSGNLVVQELARRLEVAAQGNILDRNRTDRRPLNYVRK